MTLHIVGAGGFGRETLDAVRAAAAAPEVVFVDEYPAVAAVDGCPVLLPGQWVAAPDGQRNEFVVAIADADARRRLARQFEGHGMRAATVIDPRAVVSPGARVGRGCVVLGQAFISTGTVLGAHVQVNYQASIGHDTVIEDFVTILPGANIAGGVSVGAGSTVGSNAAVLQGRRIGPSVMVGAAALVTRDVTAGQLVIGIPAGPRPGADTGTAVQPGHSVPKTGRAP
ncbi:sugar O-acyltransferase (sialic acid O-acetyltransferase NeuD family) [Streptomyces sp. B4I13]|uniref:acetyltransferase n=1 Tax=Streptomyces sp. B4I13 TaxID=3042271 RepID=UPI002784B7E5|nr:acetyltransferase [Streptomyces sp. B4I13]MDQ0956286.1 sugar O-acyltransferase (sialic acid O-acetyltransferase NeuD family) [Streptomyces sp. B4I13]